MNERSGPIGLNEEAHLRPFLGLRITVWDVLDMLASGMSEDEIPTEYPYLLEKADFPAVYAYASQTGQARVSR